MSEFLYGCTYIVNKTEKTIMYDHKWEGGDWITSSVEPNGGGRYHYHTYKKNSQTSPNFQIRFFKHLYYAQNYTFAS